MRLADLLHHAGLSPHNSIEPDAVVRHITEDSRRVEPGDIFIARPGLRADGRRFIADAIRAGAIAIVTDIPPEADTNPTANNPAAFVITPDPALAGARLAEHLAGNPSSHLQLIGVTGTNGKSTVVALIHQLAIHASIRCGMIGTVDIDDGTGPIPSDFTTPPAERLSPLLRRMADNHCAAAAMEVSSHALDQRRVAGLRFAAAVFTNLTGDHLDYHKTLDAYAAAKARLFESLAPDALAVVNADDPASARMTTDCPARVVTCALDRTDLSAPPPTPAPDAAATILSTSTNGMTLRLAGPWGIIETQTRLLGAHNATNLLQAVTVCALVLKIEPQRLAAAIPTLRPPTGRLERVDRAPDDITVLIDFAHTDDALTCALRAARLATPESARLWAVFGCGGDKDRTKRPRMGLAAATLADIPFITSDNPRTEPPDSIIDEVAAGVPDDRRDTLRRDADRAAAIHAAIVEANPGDVIVIAGKGHEHEQILPDGKGSTYTIPFDDHQVARAALRARAEQRTTATPINTSAMNASSLKGGTA